MRKRILDHFGLAKKGSYQGKLFTQARKDIENAVKENQMIAVAGDVGAGKTYLFNAAKLNLSADYDNAPKFVYVRNFYKEHLTIGGIMTAIIMDLSNETPRRDLEARSRQVVRLLGSTFVRSKQRVSVVIEEAHRVHYNTMRAIKELREADFNGVTPLFSVILIGHPELTVKLSRRKEVFWRSQLLDLSQNSQWMDYAERVSYLRSVYGDIITQTARERIAALCRVPLEMDVFVDKRLESAYKAGYEKLTEDAIEMSPKEMKEALSVSLGDIADVAGVGRTTVHDVLEGKGSDTSKAAVAAALDKIAQRHSVRRSA